MIMIYAGKSESCIQISLKNYLIKYKFFNIISIPVNGHNQMLLF